MTHVPVLDTQRPRFSPEEAKQLAADIFRKEGSIDSLPSERDQNFRVSVSDGNGFVLKISSASEQRDVLELQHAALIRLASEASDVPVPRVVCTTSGEEMSRIERGGVAHWVRMLTYLEGTPLAHARPRDGTLLRLVGWHLGTLDRSLTGFSHPAAARELYWDLTRSRDVIASHLGYVTDAARRATIDMVVTWWDDIVAPRMRSLRRSVIHNDANDYNVLVGDPRDVPRPVTGFIDFGDMLESITVADPAIAAAYGLLEQANPLRAAAHVISGYHDAFPLVEDELEVLPVLIAARLAVSVCISARRGAEEPDHEYLAVSEAPAWHALGRLTAVHPRLARNVLRDACGLDACPHSRSVVHWLEAHRGAAGPVMSPDPSTESCVEIDLHVGSADFPDSDRQTGTPELCDAVDAFIEAAGGGVGIGRYNEARLVYTRDEFGGSPTGSSERRTIHMGVDLFAPPGTEILAPLDGTVHSIKNNAVPLDYGPAIILEHAPGDGPRFFTLYGHLDPECLARVKPGTKVRRGDVLAHLGAFEVNGNWPPHLHLQLITDVLDAQADFPGVAAPGEREVWRSLSPDPNLLLALPRELRAPERSVGALTGSRQQLIGPGLSVAYQEPLHVVRGRGQTLYDAAGRTYLDAVNNVAHVGHSHPTVVRAAARQMAVLNTNTRYLHEAILEYAARLCRLFPDPLTVCYLVCSGSEANELALRLARAHTGGTDLVVLRGAYHGNTGALIDASPYKFDGTGGQGAPPHVHVAEMPDDYRGQFRREDSDRGRKYAEDVRRALERAHRAGRTVSAFLSESLMGCGGQIDPPPGYLAAAYAHARAAGAVCIADEVQIGFGRMGSHFWGFETQDVVPDIVTLGKPIGNGHPLGAVVTTAAIAMSFDDGMEYFNTFGGNPVSCAVGLAVLDVIEGQGLQQHALDVGSALRERLTALQQSHPVIGDVRGRGLFLGVELVRNRQTREPAPAVARYVVERMKELGVLLSTDGPDANVLKIKPPMVFSAEDGDRLVAALDRVLAEDLVVAEASTRRPPD